MRVLRRWSAAERTAHGLELAFPCGARLALRVLEPTLVRVSLTRAAGWRLDRSWTVAPGAPGPVEGRARDSVDGFSCPVPELAGLEGAEITLRTGGLVVTVAGDPLRLAWRLPDGRPLAADRPTGAYYLRTRDHAHEHYMARVPGEPVHGLGEKAGRLDRAGRRFEMRNLDAMGYDAETTDPLYKHIPFALTRTAAGWWSILYDNGASMVLDLGNELDNYHPPYRVMRAEDGDLDYYFAAAPTALELVKLQTWLTGGAAFPPRWSLGYSGSTMQYTDLPDAAALIEGFAERAAAEGMAAESFHLSSGYTSIGAKRYVFNWNRDKFPDPPGFAARCRQRGMRLVANIKPCLLQDHPRYGEAAAAGLLVRAGEAPERSVFWDDEGSHLDFTNPATRDWWREGVRRELLANGIAATWNDNNEFEIWDDEATCHGFGRPVPAALMRPALAALMVRTSHEAQVAHEPASRPYLVTRAGGPGLQALAQTWTGDNRTDWKTLRFNQRMGLGLALSGISNIGHDIGGFAGPRPSPELFLRWVEAGCLMPRFSIHSWNEDGSVTEPWMYPEVADGIRAAMALRRRLTPYLYTLLWRYHAEHEPMIRPPFLDHEDDAGLAGEPDEFLLGRDLLVAPVLDAGARERRVRLPANGAGWWELDTAAWHAGGREVTLAAAPGRLPVLVRAGTVLPVAGAAGPELMLWPMAEGEGGGLFYDDDGAAAAWPGAHLALRLELAASRNALELTWRAEGGGWRPGWRRLPVRLPAGEARPLRVNGAPAAAVELG